MRYIIGFINRFWLPIYYRKKKLKIGILSFVYNCNFGKYNTIYYKNFLSDVKLGDFTYIASNTKINYAIIGKFCSIGSNIQIGLGKHPVDFISTHPIFFSTKKQAQLSFADKDNFIENEKVTIGNDVWIGNNVLILDGVKIGNGVIVGAGAVVTKNIPDYAIVGGVPAKIIRYRFNKNEIEQLLKDKWWDKDIEWLKTNTNNMYDIKRYIDIIKK